MISSLFHTCSHPSPQLLSRRATFKFLQADSTLFGPVAVQMKHAYLRLANLRRRPDLLPSSPANTKQIERHQAQFSTTSRAGKIFPRPSRRCVIGFLPIRLRPCRSKRFVGLCLCAPPPLSVLRLPSIGRFVVH